MRGTRYSSSPAVRTKPARQRFTSRDRQPSFYTYTPVLGQQPPCPRCLPLYLDRRMRVEAVQPLPSGAWAARARDGSGPCCKDCEATDGIVGLAEFERRNKADDAYSGFGWTLLRLEIGHHRFKQLRFGTNNEDHALAGSIFFRPSAPGDLAKHRAWLEAIGLTTKRTTVTKPDGYPDTPTLDRLGEINVETQAIGEFIDWLLHTKQADIQVERSWTERVECGQDDALWESMRQVRDELGQDEVPVHKPTCRCEGKGWYLRSYTEPETLHQIQPLLAEFFNVDLHAQAEEQDAVLAYWRKHQEKGATDGVAG